MFDTEGRRAQRPADLSFFEVEATGPCWVVVCEDDGLLLNLAYDASP